MPKCLGWYVLVLTQTSNVRLLRLVLYGTLVERRSYLLCPGVEENRASGLSVWAQISATGLAI